MMKRKIKKKNIYFAVLILVFFSSVFIVFAKYHLTFDERVLYDANDFYFESNLLYDNNNKKSYTYKKGVDYIEFKISNNVDELRYSEVKINYSVEITDIDGNTITDKDGDEIGTIEGTLDKGIIDSKVIRFENLKSGIYVVTALSTKPYKKQIQANFIITEKDEDITYVVSDVKDSPILNLTVSTKDYDGNIKISWPSGVAPDSTDSNFSDVNTGYSAGNVVVSFKANSEYIFRFFKEDSLTVYSNNDFIVGGDS